MKLLSIIIPSYNSEKFIANCLDSLLIGVDEEIEVIVINDGSKDKTSEIAHSYADKYPFVKVVDKENGGHGSGINRGAVEATGLYYIPLDSDDSLSKEGLLHLLDSIKKHQKENTLPDVYVSDYLSLRVGTDDYTVCSLKKRFPRIEDIVRVEEFPHFGVSDCFMIHMMCVKTSILKDTHINLPEHTFYVDTVYKLHVMKYADTYFYLDKPVYLYSLGVENQSVSFKNVDKNYMHQIRVMEECVRISNYDEYLMMNKGKRKQILHELAIAEILTHFYIFFLKNNEKTNQYKEYIKFFKTTNHPIYKELRYKTYIFFLWLFPIWIRSLVIRIGYKIFVKKKGWAF